MIYTFYSYKGGVGRSMALANVAEYLYRKGLRVVIVDWDLEAPGLESFFFDPKNSEGEEQLSLIRSQLGLIDLLLSYKRSFPSIKFTRPQENGEDGNSSAGTLSGNAPASPAPLSVAEQVELLEGQLTPVQTNMYAIHEAGSLPGNPKAALWLLPAGWREGERFSGYSQAVQSFDWADLYINYNAKVFFEWLRKQLVSMSDVVLIDSRTGVTEMGGVCTRQLADVVVSFTVLNNQNMDGVAKMMRSFKRKDKALLEAREGRAIETMVVPTRIESSDLKIRAKLLEDFETVMGEVPNAFKEANVTTYTDLAVPYVTTYAYFEKLAIGGDDNAFELERAYINLATHLVLFARKDSALRACFSRELSRKFDISYARVPFMPPPLPSGFAGRADVLESLRALLLTHEVARAGASVALCGPAGSGKSAVAAAFAHGPEVAATFKDGILWATLGVNPDVRQKLSDIYQALTGLTHSFPNTDEVCKAIAERLTDKRCLVVVDDVWGLDDVRPFLKLGNLCSYLITTRDPMLPTSVNAVPITVGALTPDEALTFLRAQVKVSDDYRTALQELARRSGSLPLTLKLIAAALRLRVEGVEDETACALEYINRRLDEKGIIAFDHEGTSERDQSVALSIADSLYLLGEKERERYIRLALLLDGDGLGFDEVSRLWGGDKLETEDQRRRHALETEESLQRLHAISLLEYNLREKRVRLSPPLRAYLLGRLPSNVGLDIKAERAFAGLSPEEQMLARRLFTRLVRVARAGGGGDARADVTGGDTRARVTVSRIDGPTQRLVQILTDAGILVEEQDKLTGERKLQLADESLIQSWGRLQKWVNDDREFLYWRQQLRTNVNAWERGSKDSFLKAADLEAALRWRGQRAADLEKTEHDYIESSQRSERRQRIVFVVGLIVTLLVLGLVLLWFLTIRPSVNANALSPITLAPPAESLAARPYPPLTNSEIANSGNANAAALNQNVNQSASGAATQAQRPLVYLQFNDTNDQKTLSLVQGDLIGARFNAQDVEHVERSFAPEVRYFYPEDRPAAEAVSTVVEYSLIKAGYQKSFLVRYVRGAAAARKGQIEVWIPSLAGGTSLKRD